MTAPEQTSYQQALAQAAALYAATKIIDPLQQLGAAIDVSARALRQAEDAATQAITSLWRATNPYDDRSVNAFASNGGRVLLQAQRTVAQITASTRTQQLQLSGVNVTVSPQIPDNIRGTTSSGAVRRRRARMEYADGQTRTVPRGDADTDKVLARVAETYRYRAAEGQPHEDSLAAADKRLEVIVDGNLQRARTIVEQRSIEQAQKATVDLDRTVIGYRRVIHPELSKSGVCGMCIVAADRKYKVRDLKAIHARCKCTVVEIFEDFDPGKDLNGKDLNALYKAAEGNTRDLLKRTRYQLVDHDELGLLLVGKKGAPIPYFAPQ
ncbi:hypothetical protein [Nocardia wallacei]|uniref:hypothetical protein n=1 Tax=Nocardia wallacei TaxID=480035 RepID=UPI002458D813|nr:hypothetical protein [Nocardia wallacei]